MEIEKKYMYYLKSESQIKITKKGVKESSVFEI
jgi:hypothetical protein